MESIEKEKIEKTETKGKTPIEKMFSAGAHFGYSKRRRHPSMSQFIFGAKNKVEIFDLEKTSILLENAKEYAKKLGSENETILFVGGKNEAKSALKEGAISVEMPYVAGRWIGGTITNFSEIKKRIERLEDLTLKREKGEFETKYTKKEQLMLDREITDLELNFFGLLSMKELPKALFVIDTKKEHIAVAEAQAKTIPIIGLLNSDCNVKGIDFPIVANDASRTSILFFIHEIVEAYKEGKKLKKE
ncbi:30S ribosomal protein S2 [Patescibacteria group bacterium]|nr:30S ribosomal protein S2 [Patescibacteria group bacterium]